MISKHNFMIIECLDILKLYDMMSLTCRKRFSAFMNEKFANLGSYIKKLRHEKGLTLNEMVEYTGLSIGYLSNIERNATSPTLNSLISICNALDINLVDLLNAKSRNKTLLHRADCLQQEYPESRMAIFTAEFGSDAPIIQVMSIQPGEPNEVNYWRHSFSEVATVIKGVLLVDIEGTEYRVLEGDSILIGARKKHATRNGGTEECISVWTHNYKMI